MVVVVVVVEEVYCTDFYLEKVLRRTVDLFKGLLAGIRHCLHFGSGGGGKS